MTFAHAKPGVPGARDYIGNSDGPARGPRPGTQEFIKQLSRVSNGAIWNLGTYGRRDMKGKPGKLSVHATGRAIDASFLSTEKNPQGNRKRARQVINTILEHANEFGIQAVYDYFPIPFGAGWRCDRQKWQKYTVKTISGAPRGTWYHIELEPRIADNAEAVKALFTKVFG
jgi:hypothetical protein